VTKSVIPQVLTLNLTVLMSGGGRLEQLQNQSGVAMCSEPLSLFVPLCSLGVIDVSMVCASSASQNPGQLDF
jgi:hypothetical protein